MENLHISLNYIYDKSLKIMTKSSMIMENSHLTFSTLSDIEKGKLCIFM